MTRVLAGRYELVRLLGRGTVGEVHCAHDRVLGRDVAVKLFRAGLDPDRDDERRQAEMALLAGFNHPHIVPAYDAGEEDGLAYLVMHLVHGRTLADCLPLPPERVAEVGRALSSALAHVHAQGVVHRDLKPANVLLGDDGGVWLSDFGIAKLLDDASRTATGITIGTAGYLSPEQVRGTAVGPATDVYALGLVLLEALTGQRAYPGGATEAALARLHRRPDVPPDLPAPWPDLLTAMTADRPTGRPTAMQVHRALTAPRRPPLREPIAVPRPTPGTSRGLLGEVLAETARSRVAQGLLAAFAVVALMVTALVAGTGGRDAVPAAGEGPAAAAPAGTATTADIAGVSLFHPGGSDGDDPQDAPLAADGEAGTAWSSQRYASPAFGGLRPGVGLLYDLGRPVEVTELRLQLPYPGAALRVHAGERAGDGLLKTPARATSAAAPAQTTLRTTGPAARYWVVWFERLPERGQRRAGIAETRFVAR